MSASPTEHDDGGRSTAESAFLAVSGLPGRLRAVWAQALSARPEPPSPWAHRDLWPRLRGAAAAPADAEWDLDATGAPEAGEDPTAFTSIVETLRDAQPFPSEHLPNICSTQAARALPELAADHPGMCVLVLYQSPWEALAQAVQVHRLHDGAAAGRWLDYWQRYHQAALACREALPDRTWLVNAGRMSGHEQALLQMLRDRAIAIPDTALEDLQRHRVPDASPAGLEADLCILGSRYCETYEELETVALLCGRQPQFRGVGNGPQRGTLAQVIQQWTQALAAGDIERDNAFLRAQVRELQDQVESLSRTNQALVSWVERSAAIARKARELISAHQDDLPEPEHDRSPP